MGIGSVGRKASGGITVALAVAGVALAPAPTAAQDFTWRGRLAAGATLEVKGVIGDIRAVAADGDGVQVDAEKYGRRDDPAGVEIVVLEHDEGVTICAVYPSGRDGRPNECAPGDAGRLNARDNDVHVNFTVRVPAGVRLVARTVNGEVEAEGLGGDVVASTVNGDVSVSTAGLVEANTVNGSIHATLGRADWTDDLEFETVNGGITLVLPAEVNADVRAGTVNGRITSDFPLRVEGRLSRRRLRGTIGAGGHELSLGTVNGSIRIRKST
ncbi:MAG TPA: DUF4097 family beta strand repeat-containing protein [Longimicrobiales bacterium]